MIFGILRGIYMCDNNKKKGDCLNDTDNKATTDTIYIKDEIKNKFKVNSCIVLADSVLIIIILYGIIFCNNIVISLTGKNLDIIIFIIAIILYAYISVAITKKVVFSCENKDFINLKNEIDDQVTFHLTKNIDDKASYIKGEEFKERKTKYLDEVLISYEDYKGLIFDVISSVIGSLLISITVALVTKWAVISEKDTMNYLGGITLVVFFAIMMFHLIFIFFNIKYKYYCWKALRELRLECI